MVRANDNQVGGSHYQADIQTWDYVLSHDLGFLEGNIIKYVTRHRKKHGVQDLRKAMHYLQKLIEVENGRVHDTHFADSKANEGLQSTDATASHRGRNPDSRTADNRSQTTLECDQVRGFRPKGLRDII